MITYDGQVYKNKEDVPDFGSLKCVHVSGNRRFYQGLTQDAWKLPKYDNLGTGSMFEAVDSSLIKRYESTTKTWYIKDGTAESYVDMEGDLQPLTHEDYQEFFENNNSSEPKEPNEGFGGNIEFDDFFNK